MAREPQNAPKSVTIPTMEDIYALQSQIDDQQGQIDGLNERVTALEEGGPPEPPDPPEGGTGPAVTGWLTADFARPHHYYETQEQQIIDPLTYGTSTGGAGDNRFKFFADEKYTSQMAKINIPLWYFIANISSGNSYFKDDSSVDEAVFDNLVNNWRKVDPRGISRWLFGLNYPMRGVTDATSYGKCAGNLARFLLDKGLPLIGVTGPDEPDSRNQGELHSYVNALISACHQVDPSLIVTGASTSWADSGCMRNFMNACEGTDWISWNMYPAGSDIGEQAWKNPQYRDRAAGDIKNMRNNAPSRPAAYHIGGFNMDWSCTAASQHTYCAAVFATLVLIDTLNGANAPARLCIWDSEGDGTCGFVPDPNNGYTQGYPQELTPFAYLWGRLVARVTGKRQHVSGGVGGLRTVAVTREDGGASLLVLNAGQGSQRGKEIALSSFPGNAEGDAELEIWQMTNECSGVGEDGNCWGADLTGGKCVLDFPDPSVTVIASV